MPAPRPPTWSARSGTAGGWPSPPWPSSGGWACSATSSPSAASSTTSWTWPGPTGGRPTRSSASAWPAPTPSSRSSGYNTLRSLSGYDGPVAPPEASIIKLYWASWHRRLGELAIDVLGPAGLVAERLPLRARRVPAHLPVQPVGDHLRRLQRDPEEHHRRAGPRPAARTQGGSPMTDAEPTGPPGGAGRPESPARRRATGCSTGKVVVVTAAAGTGIGFATAKRCVEEGATVVISDAHERRLGEAADALADAARAGRRAPAGRALQRDRRGPGAAPLRRRRRAPRPVRRGRQQRRPRGPGRRGGHDRRAVVTWSSTSP